MSNVLADLKNILGEVSHAVEAGNLGGVLQRIAESARSLVNTRYAALGIPDGQGGLLYFKTTGMTQEEEIALQDHHGPVGRGLLGAVMQERVVMTVPNIQSDPRSSGFPEGHPEMQRFLGAPVQVGPVLYGMLYLTDRLDGQHFDDRDRFLVETLAGYAALAISGIQVTEQQNRITLLEERERIAMELHDGIIQSLYAIGMHLALIRNANKGLDGGLDSAITGLDGVIDDIRDYILDLRTSSYEAQTMYESFQDLVTRLQVPESIEIEINAPHHRPRCAIVTFEALCQIVNEGLSNAVRHAQASRITITATEEEGALLVVVSDDGQGFDLNHLTRYNGLGLRNIQQRARINHGSVSIETAPGEGTRLEIRFPT